MRRVMTIFFILATVTGLALGVPGAEAATLDLLGVGWSEPQVPVLIKAGTGVTPEAVLDVQRAIADRNAALARVSDPEEPAPQLILLSSGNTADIVIQMKVGGGAVLGQALPKTVSPFRCVLKSVSIQLSGKAFGQGFSSAGTQNVARHEIGHGLGLGHADDAADLM